MYYVPYGPFWPRKYIDSGERYWRSNFWEEVERVEDGLSRANGVYVFSLSFGDKFTPWYVGKTCSRDGFRQEVFQGHKLAKYFATSSEKRGYPALHLVARVEENRGNFCRMSARALKQIEQLETYLIGMGLTVNPEMRNDKKTSFHRNLDVEGVIGPKYEGARREAARTLRNVLNLGDR